MSTLVRPHRAMGALGVCTGLVKIQAPPLKRKTPESTDRPLSLISMRHVDEAEASWASCSEIGNQGDSNHTAILSEERS